MRAKDIAMLLLLAALWGASYLFIRVAVPSFGPLMLVELRVLLAAASLAVYALVRRQRLRLLHRWWQYLVLGAVNAALPFALISFAELRLDAALASILNATTPMFTAVVSWLWLKDPFTLKKMGGVLLGIVGVAIVIGWHPGSGAHVAWLFASGSLLAAIFYAVGGVFSSRQFQGEKPLDMAVGQQLGAGVVLFPFCFAALPHTVPSGAAILSVAGLAVLCTALAYLLYFALIQNVGALKTLTVTFLVPVFGVLWGSLFLHEEITMHLILGLLVILLSVGLVVNIRFKRRQHPLTPDSKAL
ncbi:MAG: DMT family transporter [Alicyclobacillus sp.]|nr:DMT family transporter [Alicyclobacillus sp.]